MWRDTLPLTVTINGVVVGSPSTGNIASASFGAGRPDWFDALSPSTGTFTFKDMTLADFKTLIGSSVPAGKSVVVSLSGSPLWTGVVDTAVEDEAPGEPTTVTITAIDQVAQMGAARLEDVSLAGDDIDSQLILVFGSGGLTVDPVSLPGLRGNTLGAIDPLSGSVLDWMTSAEEDVNCLIATAATGEQLIIDRGHFGDYGDRVGSDYWTGAVASALWRMDESSGNLADSIGGGGSATAAGSPTYGQTGPWGSDGPDAIGFQASDAADKFEGGDVFDLTGGTWDIAGWFYWSGSGTCTIISKFTSSPSNNGWTIDVSASGLRYRSFNSGTTTTSIDSGAGSITANRWYHFNVSASGGTVRLQLNGVTVDSDTLGTIPNTTALLRVGTLGSGSNWWDGRLCMISIWNSAALTAAQVLALIYLGRVGLTGANSPSDWTRTESITTVVNHWIFRQPTVTSHTDSTSIAAYGDRTMEIEADSGTTALSTSYPAALRTHLENPRPTIACAFHVTGSAQELVARFQPLDYVTRDGEEWQVMSVQHEITPDSWDVTMTLSETVAGLTGVGSVLPV